MKVLNDGGPAFPRPLGGDVNNYWNREQDGMSLRDWFAGQALAGLFANPNAIGTFQDIADDTYKVADAMLKAREVKP